MISSSQYIHRVVKNSNDIKQPLNTFQSIIFCTCRVCWNIILLTYPVGGGTWGGPMGDCKQFTKDIIYQSGDDDMTQVFLSQLQ